MKDIQKFFTVIQPRTRIFWACAVAAVALGIASVVMMPMINARAAATYIFTAAGDFGSNSNADAVLTAMKNSGSVFSLALGDLGYVSTGGETAWCNRVKNIVGQTYPFELIAGNHEDDTQANGFIGNYILCLPDRLGVTGTYGSEYYFDYGDARIIMAAAASSVNGDNINYNTVGSAHYNWMRDRIREGKAAGRWVIVGVHKNCITPGTKSCELGQNFVNLVHTEGVDLFIQGHEHIYARSKQLTCATAGSYNAACVVNTSDLYTRGAGTTTIITGASGQSFYNINASDSERLYFVKAMAGNGWWNWVDNTTGTNVNYGALKVTVSTNRLDVAWIPAGSGTFSDSFAIEGNVVPTLTPTNTPIVPTSTSTWTNTPAPATNTPTWTNTPGPITNTPTRTITSTPGALTATPAATATRTNTPTSSASSVVSFQDGVLPNTSYAGTIDTILKQANATSNYGSVTTLEADGDDGSGVDKSVLIKWDTSTIPVGKTVTAATITFRVLDASSNTYQLYESKRNWVENQATWNIFSTANNWQTAGALGANDRGSTTVGTFTSSSSGVFYTITLNASGLALVQNWVNNPSANFGLVIANATNTNGLDFSSSEASTTTYRPKLTITYQ